MKLVGILGTGSGKLGSSVFSTVAGQQVVRQYQPVVANPSTINQVNQRARLKLASQLAAAIAPVIAIPRQGMQTSRNLFIKRNFDFISANNGQAMISYENIQLTTGNAGLPGIAVSRSQESGVVVSLQSAADSSVNRVVYILFKKTNEEQLQYIGSNIATVPGDAGNFQSSFAYTSGELIIWAYGMKDMNASARAKYGDYYAASGEDIAQLVMNRSLSAADYQFTGTRGATLFSGESENQQAADGQFMVYLTASGPGSVTGTGFTNGRKAVTAGEQASVTATPNTGCQFLGWRLNGSAAYVSTSATYTFEVTRQTDLVAVFNDPNSNNGGTGGSSDQGEEP